jgi:hypothetical protein
LALAPNKRMGLTPDPMKDELYKDIVSKLKNFKIRYPPLNNVHQQSAKTVVTDQGYRK